MSATPSPTKQAAIVAGLVHYVGKLCPHGHDGTRYVLSGKCVGCVKSYNLAYKRGMRPGTILWRRSYHNITRI